jgi:hypothetical protein
MSDKLKNNLNNILSLLIPDSFFERQLKTKLDKLNSYDKDYILDRVNYYNKISDKFQPDEKFQTIKEFKKSKKKLRFFDLYKYLRYFDKNMHISTFLGDHINKLPSPTFIKSRLIEDNHENFVLMNLGKIRHFIYMDDRLEFEDKKDMIVWRGACYRPHRKELVQKFYNHPLCDIGQTNKPKEDAPWEKNRMTREEQLEYKFILSIEGNDVATNLKWIMSSNSLVFMTKPKYESWYMEGRLVPNYHYVLLKDDYSDLEEKIEYYSQNINESLNIIKNAKEYLAQFKDDEREDLISLLVLKKYFELSRQI